MNTTLTTYTALEESIHTASKQLRALRCRQTELLHKLCHGLLEAEPPDAYWYGNWRSFDENLTEQVFHIHNELFIVTLRLYRRLGEESLSVEFSMPPELALPQDDFDTERVRAYFADNPESIYVE